VEIEGLTEELSSTAENTEVTMEEVVRTRRGVSTLLPGSSTGYGPLVPIADERLRQVAKLEREREREEARAKEVREGREAGDTKVDEMCNWCVCLVAGGGAISS